MEFKHVELSNKGAIRAIEDDIQYGEIIYSKMGATEISVDYTEVEPISKGKGVGKQLVHEIVALARDRGWKVQPICSFVKSILTKNPDYEDVLS